MSIIVLVSSLVILGCLGVAIWLMIKQKKRIRSKRQIAMSLDNLSEHTETKQEKEKALAAENERIEYSKIAFGNIWHYHDYWRQETSAVTKQIVRIADMLHIERDANGAIQTFDILEEMTKRLCRGEYSSLREKGKRR